MTCLPNLLSNERVLCKKVLNKCWGYDLSGKVQWIPAQEHRL